MQARGRVKKPSLEKVLSGVLATALAALLCFFCVGSFLRNQSSSSSAYDSGAATAAATTEAASGSQSTYSQSATNEADASDVAGASSGTAASQASSGAVLSGATEASSSGSINISTKKKYQIIYTWEGIPSSAKVYDAHQSRVTLTLPTQQKVREGDLLLVNALYSQGTTVYEFNDSGVMTGWYVFSGWKLSGDVVSGTMTMPGKDITLEGQWVYTQKPVDPEPSETAHQVTYSWKGLPDSPTVLYAQDGTPWVVSLPAGETAEQGTPYSIDSRYYAGLTLYAHDANGFSCMSYTFAGWKCNGTAIEGVQTMGDVDVSLTGAWSSAEIEVPHVISYQWENAPDASLELFDAQGNVVKIALPTGAALYEGETFQTDAQYTPGMTLYQYTPQGYVIAEYVFGGWTVNGAAAPAQLVVGSQDVALCGVWTASMKTYQVSYAWTWEDEEGQQIDAPAKDQQFYDETGKLIDFEIKLPETISKTSSAVIAVDTRFTKDLVLYVHNEAGEVTGRYEFSGWDQEGEFALEDYDVEITGVWTYYEQE